MIAIIIPDWVAAVLFIMAFVGLTLTGYYVREFIRFFHGLKKMEEEI